MSDNWTQPASSPRASQRSPNRAMLRAVGFGDADFDKPIVGVANGHSTITPCNVGPAAAGRLRPRRRAKKAGAMPQMFGTITVTDGISMGTEGMKYSLVSREVIADSIETAVNGQRMDGVLAVGGCDKNMPGAMIAIGAHEHARRSSSTAAPSSPAATRASDLTIVSVFEAVGEFTAGKIGKDELVRRSSAAPARRRAPAAACTPPTPCPPRSRRWA